MHANPPSEADGTKNSHPIHCKAKVGRMYSNISYVYGATAMHN